MTVRVRTALPWLAALGTLAVALGLAFHVLFNWMLTFSGARDEGGSWYGFWSGFGGCFLAPQPAIFATAWILLRHHNCHVKGCWALGHKVDGTPYVACHVHHPAHHGDDRNVSVEQIHTAYKERRK